MSDRDDNSEIIKNEDTLNRRAWVDKAITIARQRLESGAESASRHIRPRRPRLVLVPGRKDRQ